MDSMMLINAAIMIIFFMLAMVVHEYAHGFVAYKLGDLTAKYEGRLSLNPLAHIDPVGTVLMPLILYFSTGFIFGYAKPVPVNFLNLRNPKKDMIWVGVAGPAANILLATVVGMLIKYIFGVDSLLAVILNKLILINLFLAVFNLIPIPPLDGSRILMGFLPPKQAESVAHLEQYGMFILMGVLFLGPRFGINIIGEFVYPVCLFLYKIIMF